MQTDNRSNEFCLAACLVLFAANAEADGIPALRGKIIELNEDWDQCVSIHGETPGCFRAQSKIRIRVAGNKVYFEGTDNVFEGKHERHPSEGMVFELGKSIDITKDQRYRSYEPGVWQDLRRGTRIYSYVSHSATFDGRTLKLSKSQNFTTREGSAANYLSPGIHWTETIEWIVSIAPTSCTVSSTQQVHTEFDEIALLGRQHREPRQTREYKRNDCTLMMY
jgi:hypothetical protein